MSYIVIGLSHHTKAVSRVVKWFSHGRYSHVMLCEPGGRRYIESSGTAKPSGVQIRDMSEFFGSRPEWEFRKVYHPNPQGVWDAACKRVGRKYDWMYFLAWLLRMPWLQDVGKDVCNELILDSCIEAGYSPFPDGIEPTYLTPNHWDLISDPLE